ARRRHGIDVRACGGTWRLGVEEERSVHLSREYGARALGLLQSQNEEYALALFDDYLLHRCYTRACGYWVACELAARLIGYSRCCTVAKCPRARTAATAESGERSVHP